MITASTVFIIIGVGMMGIGLLFTIERGETHLDSFRFTALALIPLFIGMVLAKLEEPKDAKPHWHCPECNHGKYNVLKNGKISCKACSWSNKDD